MPTVLDVLHGLGPLTTVQRLDRHDLACLAGVLPGALPAPLPRFDLLGEPMRFNGLGEPHVDPVAG